MTKYKSGESKAEIKIRRIVEHNKKIITEHFHLDYDKVMKQHGKDLGEHYRSITAKFTDKEMEEASKIGFMICDLIKPEDGMTYEEVAMILRGTGKAVIPEEYLKDDMYIQKINRLLYVLQMIVFEFGFNTTMEEHEKGRRGISMIPHVRIGWKEPVYLQLLENMAPKH